jgi:hypothetical protein
VARATGTPPTEPPPPGAPAGRAQTHEELVHEVDALVDECRIESLWYLRRDWYPTTDRERLQVLDAIQEHTHVDAFRRAGRLKEWLSRHSKDESAGS